VTSRGLLASQLPSAVLSNGSQVVTTESICEVRKMSSLRLIETVALKHCHACAADLPTTDNFCRQCGILQRGGADKEMRGKHWSEGKTGLIKKDEEANQLLSGLLVNAITQKVAIRTGPLRSSPFGARIIAAIVVIPIWLLIVLLSPLDAYLAARDASSHINC
jgi:ribosomal protein L40E